MQLERHFVVAILVAATIRHIAGSHAKYVHLQRRSRGTCPWLLQVKKSIQRPDNY